MKKKKKDEGYKKYISVWKKKQWLRELKQMDKIKRWEKKKLNTNKTNWWEVKVSFA